MDLGLLRSATRHEHESVEARMPLTDPHLSLATYTRVLTAMYIVLSGWEQWAAANVPEDLTAAFHARKRAALLRSDLQALGAPMSSANTFAAERIPGARSHDAQQHRAAFLGAMYVIEGSTLGGQYIARHVEPLLGLSAQHGTAYFRGYGEDTGKQWTEFKAVLAAVPDEISADVIAAAKATFAIFEDAITPAASLR